MGAVGHLVDRSSEVDEVQVVGIGVGAGIRPIRRRCVGHVVRQGRPTAEAGVHFEDVVAGGVELDPVSGLIPPLKRLADVGLVGRGLVVVNDADQDHPLQLGDVGQRIGVKTYRLAQAPEGVSLSRRRDVGRPTTAEEAEVGHGLGGGAGVALMRPIRAEWIVFVEFQRATQVQVRRAAVGVGIDDCRVAPVAVAIPEQGMARAAGIVG